MPVISCSGVLYSLPPTMLLSYNSPIVCNCNTSATTPCFYDANKIPLSLSLCGLRFLEVLFRPTLCSNVVSVQNLPLCSTHYAKLLLPTLVIYTVMTFPILLLQDALSIVYRNNSPFPTNIVCTAQHQHQHQHQQLLQCINAAPAQLGKNVM